MLAQEGTGPQYKGQPTEGIGQPRTVILGYGLAQATEPWADGPTKAGEWGLGLAILPYGGRSGIGRSAGDGWARAAKGPRRPRSWYSTQLKRSPTHRGKARRGGCSLLATRLAHPAVPPCGIPETVADGSFLPVALSRPAGPAVTPGNSLRRGPGTPSHSPSAPVRHPVRGGSGPPPKHHCDPVGRLTGGIRPGTLSWLGDCGAGRAPRRRWGRTGPRR